MTFHRAILLLFLGLSAVAVAAGQQVTQRIITAPQKIDPEGKVPTEEEMAKIMRAFVTCEPRITQFGDAFPNTKAVIYFEDRKTKKVRFDTSIEVDGGTYVVMLFFGLQLDQEMASVMVHKCLLFGAQYIPPDITNVSQVGPLIKFPAEDLEVFCKAPLDYLKKHVPTEKRG
jgi:hypothetical protein